MDAIKIRRLLQSRCGRNFIGVFSIDRLPRNLPARRPLLAVCNTEVHDHPGEHWIALYIDTQGEYFDSFGEKPAKTFEAYMDKYCNSFTVNEHQLQSVTSGFCGHYTVYYCLMKMLDYSMDDIVKTFSNDTALNDIIVHNFVCKGLQ